MTTVEGLKARGVASVASIQAYSCRVIAGTSTVSRHGYGDAFDVVGVTLEDGTEYTVLNDWELNTTMPQTPGGMFLYDSAKGWHDAMLWNVILTPNYDAAHEDHIHLDLTPGRDFFQ